MTALWTTSDLLAATGAHPTVPFAATGVSIDTRTLKPGELFVALRDVRDGHDFVADALARGAAGAMVDRIPDDVAAEAPLLKVADTLEGLRALAIHARSRFAGRLIAVTGSVGKTTTKEMLRTILAAQGPTHAAEASYNNHWGVPLTLSRLPPGAAFCIAEIGMNHPGEILPLARLARPNVAVITTVERTHVGNMGSIEAIADEKAALLEALEPGGVAILPADSPLLPRLLAHAGPARVATFGGADRADARLVGFAPGADGSDIDAEIGGIRVKFRLNAPGRHMAMNAIAALAAAAAAGAGLAAAVHALAQFSAVSGRGARRSIAVPGGTALLLDESYNASAASIRAALSVLALQPARRRIAVLGDMLELGADGVTEHASLAADVAANADLLFACGPLMRSLYEAIPASHRGAHAENSATLAPVVAAALLPGDAVLVKGSLGSRMKTIVSALEAAPPESR